MSTASNIDIARAIYLAIKGKSEKEQSEVLKQVVKYLSKKNLLAKSRTILFSLEKVVDQEEGRLSARVWSKDKLEEHTKKELRATLSQKYGGKTVNLEEHLEPKLLGGFKIEIGDEVIDLSIKNKIGKLQEYLTRTV